MQCVAGLLPLAPPPLLLSWLIYSAEMLIFAVAVTNVLTAVWTLVMPCLAACLDYSNTSLLHFYNQS